MESENLNGLFLILNNVFFGRSVNNLWNYYNPIVDFVCELLMMMQKSGGKFHD